jgi:hypothetical protein
MSLTQVFLGECRIRRCMSEVETAEDECRVPATLQPAGFLRFAVDEQQAEQIYDQLMDQYESVEADSLVSMRFVMNQTTYAEFLDGLERLKDGVPQSGVKHLQLAQDASYAFTVLVDERQLANAIEATSDALAEAGESDLYGQEFQLSQKAAIIVIRQLEEAFDGASDPFGAIDIGAIRENAS